MDVTLKPVKTPHWGQFFLRSSCTAMFLVVADLVRMAAVEGESGALALSRGLVGLALMLLPMMVILNISYVIWKIIPNRIIAVIISFLSLIILLGQFIWLGEVGIILVVTIVPIGAFAWLVGIFAHGRARRWLIAAVILLGLGWGAYPIIDPPDYTWQLRARSQQNENYCGRISKDNEALSCYTQFAVDRKDYSICDRAYEQQSDFWASCMVPVIYAKRDMAACATLPDDSDSGDSYRETCFREAFRYQQLPELSNTGAVAAYCAQYEQYPTLKTHGGVIDQTYAALCVGTGRLTQVILPTTPVHGDGPTIDNVAVELTRRYDYQVVVTWQTDVPADGDIPGTGYTTNHSASIGTPPNQPTSYSISSCLSPDGKKCTTTDVSFTVEQPFEE